MAIMWKPRLSKQLYSCISKFSSLSASSRVKDVHFPSMVSAAFTSSCQPRFTHRCMSSGGGGGFTSIGNSNTIMVSKEGLRSKEQVECFLNILSEEQRTLLYQSLHMEVLRDKYMSELASESHYLSKFGRPATSHTQRDTEDSQGSFSEVPPAWLQARLDSNTEVTNHVDDTAAKKVSGGDLWAVAIKNALPFVGFGFLDNLIMILAGDYIDLTIGAALGISTMAAAALGNTISDVAGIASAWYVESFAERAGIRHPVLTAAQQNTWSVRWSSNLGRALGVVIGCLLGMFPLIFLPSAEEKREASMALNEANASRSVTASTSQK